MAGPLTPGGAVLEKFTDEARWVVVDALQECRRLDHDHVSPEHLLLALLKQPDSTGTRLLTGFGIDLDALRREAERAVSAGSRPAEPNGSIPFHPLVKRILQDSLRAALREDQRIGADHLMRALFEADGSQAATMLRAAAATAVFRAQRRDLLPNLRRLSDRD